jgi:hypothetical protein
VGDGLADMIDVHQRLGLDRSVGLRDALRHARGEFGFGIADVDLADGNVVFAAVERGRLGDAGDGVLGRRVRRGVRARRVGGDRAVIDDAPAARVLVLHDAEGGLGAEKHAGEIDVDDLLPFFKRQVFERNGRRAHAGVVEENVEAAERVLGFGEEQIDVARLADIGGNRQRLDAELFDFGDGFFERLLAAAGDDDGVAILCERKRRGFADAGAAAGDEGDFLRWHFKLLPCDPSLPG